MNNLRRFYDTIHGDVIIKRNKSKKCAIIYELVGTGDIHPTYLACGVGKKMFAFRIIQFTSIMSAQEWFHNHVDRWIPILKITSESLGYVRELIMEKKKSIIEEGKQVKNELGIRDKPIRPRKPIYQEL